FERGEMPQGFVHGRRGETGGLDECPGSRNGLALQSLMNAEGRLSRTSERGDAVPILIHELQERVRRRHPLRCAYLDSLGEEVEPALPVTIHPDRVQQLVIERAVTFEKETRIQHRLPQSAPRAPLH